MRTSGLLKRRAPLVQRTSPPMDPIFVELITPLWESVDAAALIHLHLGSLALPVLVLHFNITALPNGVNIETNSASTLGAVSIGSVQMRHRNRMSARTNKLRFSLTMRTPTRDRSSASSCMCLRRPQKYRRCMGGVWSQPVGSWRSSILPW